MVCGTFLKHLGRSYMRCSQKNSQGHLKVIQGHFSAFEGYVEAIAINRPSEQF